MTIADRARAAAIHCEMKKVAYRQTKDGVVVSFVLHPQEVPAALSTSHIGARYIAALVEIGDDELPIPQAEKENVTSSVPATPSLAQDKPSEKAKRPWEEWQPQQQAGMRCNDPIFISFLKEQRADDWHETRDATECVRLICGVHSRVELGTNQRARIAWHQLDEQYLAWKAMEHA